MSKETGTTRRNVLKAGAATLFTGATAGCIDEVDSIINNDNGNGNNPGNQDPTETPEPEAPSLEVTGDQEITIEWTSELQEYDEVPEEYHIPVKIEQGGFDFEDINLVLEEVTGVTSPAQKREEPRTHRINVSNSEEVIPETELFNGPQKARLEYTNENGETQTTFTKDIVKNIPQGYRVDIRNTDGESIGDWNTPFRFDNFTYNPEQLEQERLEHIEEEFLFEGFLDDIRDDADLDQTSEVYPNHEEGGGRDWDRGHFSLDKWQQEDTPYGILEWIQPAVRTKPKLLDSKNGGLSTFSQDMATSIELSVNQIHNSNWNVHAWGFNNAGAHGTMMTYWENPETEEQKYYHVDTTDDYILEPERAQWHRDDVWSPFRSKDAEQAGFHPGPVKERLRTGEAFGGDSNLENRGLVYQAKSFHSVSALTTMSGIAKDGPKIFITDQFMDEAYEHIRNGEPLQPLLEPMQQISKIQAESGWGTSGQRVGLFGTLDNPKIVTGENEEMVPLYNDVMRNPDLMVDEQHIHDYIQELDTTQYELA